MAGVFEVWKILKGSMISSGSKKVAAVCTTSQRFASRRLRNFDKMPTKYGGKTNVTVLPGSGIGPEIMEKTIRVLKAAGAPLSFEILNFSGPNCSEDFNNILTSIRRNKVAIKANIETRSKDPSVRSRNVILRRALDLYAYVVFGQTHPGLRNKFGQIDITVIRQNTEGEYLMLEHEPRPGHVESLKVVTKYNSERLAEFAFKYALENERKHVTIVHTADVQVLTESMFVDAALAVSGKYPRIKVAVLDMDVAIVKMASNPSLFDIVLTSNLNGCMFSNFLNGIVGGPGITAGTNYGDNGIAIFEPGARSRGNSLVGAGIANPLAMIRAGINLLHHLGYQKTANIVRNSVYRTLVHDKVHTRDLGGKATTEEITNAIIRHVRLQLEMPKQGIEEKQERWKKFCNLQNQLTEKM